MSLELKLLDVLSRADVSDAEDRAAVAGARGLIEATESARVPLESVVLEVCPECGSPDVQWEDWIHINSDAATGSGDSGIWCGVCEEHGKHTEMVTLEEMHALQAAHAAGRDSE